MNKFLLSCILFMQFSFLRADRPINTFLDRLIGTPTLITSVICNPSLVRIDGTLYDTKSVDFTINGTTWHTCSAFAFNELVKEYKDKVQFARVGGALIGATAGICLGLLVKKYIDNTFKAQKKKVIAKIATITCMTGIGLYLGSKVGIWIYTQNILNKWVNNFNPTKL